MKISTEIQSIADIVGFEKSVEMVAKAGFDGWDFSLFDLCRWDWGKALPIESTEQFKGENAVALAKRLKRIGLDNGITCNQAHAPFPSTAVMMEHIIRSIECAGEAGCEIIVIHPDNNLSAQQNAEIYFKLLPYAKAYNMKIATENMWNWDRVSDHAAPAACSDPKSFLDHVNAVNDDYLVACLDIGHAEMKGLNTNAVELIHALGDKLQALHIHDNDKWHDSHQIPFSMQIDFNPIVKALKDINYSGYFTLEACEYLKAFNADTVNKGLKDMADSARKLVKMFNEC